MKAYSLRGTYYTAMGLIDRRNHMGEHFNRHDLSHLLDDGHELACHTYSHVSCRKIPVRAFTEDVEKGLAAIAGITGRKPLNFSYPFGHVTLRAKQQLSAYVHSSRGVFGGVNGQMMDLNLLKGNGLYGDIAELPKAEKLLTETAQRKGWLIFYTHDVQPVPSEFGCSPTLLERVVSAALERKFRVAPVDEVIAAATAGLARSV